MDKYWKKFEITEIKDVILDCLKNSDYIAKIEDKYFYFKFKTKIANIITKLCIKLNLVEKIGNERNTDDYKYSLLLKEIKNLKLQRRKR